MTTAILTDEATDEARRRELVNDGFCRFDGFLAPAMLARLRSVTDRMLDAVPSEQAEQTRAQGSLLPTTGDPLFAELVTYRPALDALAALGFSHPTFTDGYVISKPGGSPRLFWHYDWFAWEDPYSYGSVPPQLFLMYYLSDTSLEKGCLRVIPGSHARHNPLHDLLAEPHSDRLSRAQDLSIPEFSTRPDEADVPVRAGDLLIGDARLLHASQANQTSERRTLITLWYQPDFAHMPPRMQAQMAAKTQRAPKDWPADVRRRYEEMLPQAPVDAEPYARMLYRRQSE